MRDVVTFGEVMGRLDLPGKRKTVQALPGPLECSFAGSEANVAASIAYMGGSVRFISALPNNDLGEACLHRLRGLGIDTAHILRKEGRLGLYFVENGANQRPSKVIYDREGSVINLVGFEEFQWETIFEGASWFHISGITFGLSEKSAENGLKACRLARERGLQVSCDLNYRKKLWRWDSTLPPKDLARKVMSRALEHVTVLIANEEDISDVLDIHPEGSDILGGVLSIDGYGKLARNVVKRLPGLEQVAISLRESLSATHNNWGALLYDHSSGRLHTAPVDGEGTYAPFEIKSIVDRVGGGDSFAAGLIYALNSGEFENLERALLFAVSASCLCHSIQGDFNYSSREEIEALMGGDGSGRVQR